MEGKAWDFNPQLTGICFNALAQVLFRSSLYFFSSGESAALRVEGASGISLNWTLLSASEAVHWKSAKTV